MTQETLKTAGPAAGTAGARAPMDLEARGLSWKAADGLAVRTILQIEELQIPAASEVAVTGSSGAGKTSLMRVLSGMARPDTGRVVWAGENISALGESARDAWRGENCGFLFQDFGLLEGLSALENVLLPETFRGRITTESKARATSLLDELGVPAHTRAGRLSRGEMQRTALARVLMGRPRVIFADEPTASLDEANAKRVAEALRSAAKNLAATLIVVTHDEALAETFALRGKMEHGVWSWLRAPQPMAAPKNETTSSGAAP